MSYLTSSVPPIFCFVRKEFLFNLEKEYVGQFEECILIGVECIQNRGPTFRVLLNNGASYTGLPICAICFSENTLLSQDLVSLWDCHSYHFNVYQFQFFKNKKAEIKLKNGELRTASYLFTISYCGQELNAADCSYGEAVDKKDAHFFRTDDGYLISYPNNRIKWIDLDFVTESFDWTNPPKYRILEKVYTSENSNWKCKNSDAYFYDIDKA